MLVSISSYWALRDIRMLSAGWYTARAFVLSSDLLYDTLLLHHRETPAQP